MVGGCEKVSASSCWGYDVSDALAALELVESEASALLARIGVVQPLSMEETVVPAAMPSRRALRAVELHLARTFVSLERLLQTFLQQLLYKSFEAHEAQRRFALLRLQANLALTQYDIFSDVLTQRSESRMGLWLAGLDALATDALSLAGRLKTPPLMCYVDRGRGAAIRRARTRLPGGRGNPVAVVRLPRERLVGSGLASSLVHEVGHQGSAMLGLVEAITPTLAALEQQPGPTREAWALWKRWVSEIIPDVWAVARVGVTGTVGLLAVVSVPRAFVFRFPTDDPHPGPFIRTLLSAAVGDALYPDPQWQRLANAWEALYPPNDLDPITERTLLGLRSTLPVFVQLLLNHRAPSLNGRTLAQTLRSPLRSPATLRAIWQRHDGRVDGLARLRPTLALAAVGQAKADRLITATRELSVVHQLLRRWALSAHLSELNCPSS